MEQCQIKVDDCYTPYVLTLLCECGQRLSIEGDGWTVDFRTGADFYCKCGKKISVECKDVPVKKEKTDE